MTRERRQTYLFGGGFVALAATVVFVVGRAIGGPLAEPDAAPAMERAEPGDMDGMAGMPGMGGGGGSIVLRDTDIGTFGVTFGTVERRRLVRTIRTVGLVDFDETRTAYVAPKFGGWVEVLHGDFTGQAIRRGEPLLEVYSPELVSAQEELLLAARLAAATDGSALVDVASGARNLLDASRRRLAYWDISEAQIERLLETGEVQRTLTLHAPTSGVVVRKDIFEGQAFDPGVNLYVIADLSTVWILGEVFEGDAALIREGMPAAVTINALPGASSSGRVDYVYPTLDDTTRALKVRVVLPNPSGEVKPGMYATVRFEVDLGDALTVPTAAVLRTGTRDVAFVDMGDGALMPYELTLGHQGDAYVQVLEGLEPGMRVVTSAQYLLDSESNLAEVMRSMIAQMSTSDLREGAAMDMDMPGGRGGR